MWLHNLRTLFYPKAFFNEHIAFEEWIYRDNMPINVFVSKLSGE
jgi:hypothetical protein